MLVQQKIFFYKLVVYSTVLLAVALILYTTLLKEMYFSLFPLQFLVVFLVTAFSYSHVIKVGEKNMLRFSSAFMLMTLVKFLVYIAFLLICLLTLSLHVATFVVTFFVLYLLFSIFEVKQVLSYYKSGKA